MKVTSLKMREDASEDEKEEFQVKMRNYAIALHMIAKGLFDQYLVPASKAFINDAIHIAANVLNNPPLVTAMKKDLENITGAI